MNVKVQMSKLKPFWNLFVVWDLSFCRLDYEE